MSELTHFNTAGDAHMVDISAKADTDRTAVTEGFIEMSAATLQRVMNGDNKKGDVLGIARIAGIMASKKTADLVPLCHPLPITHVDIKLEPNTQLNRISCLTTVTTSGKTGVEMEALNATQVTLLTIYDMCKSADRSMTISDIKLIHKSGGKSGEFNA